jgi:hypothetical protein
VGADVFCEHSMNQGLVANVEALGLGTESAQDLGIRTDGNELTGFSSDRRPSRAAHCAQLLV